VRRVTKYLGTALLAGIIGSLITWSIMRPTVPNIWFQISQSEGTIYSTQAIMESDIPISDVISLQGRVRIVDHLPRTNEPVALGYILDINLSSIDPNKIPEKYSTDRPIQGTELIEPAITQPTYNVIFNFELIDRNGFTISKIVSSEHMVKSGEINKITGQSDTVIIRAKACLVDRVSVKTHFKLVHGVRSD